MCTVIVLVRPGHAWPLLLAANRDERLDRPWDPPGRHWPQRPRLVAGRDRLGGGTWMAIEDGRLAAVLNRPGSLGPQPGKRSRGGLPLLALADEDAMLSLDAAQYRTFNMVIADRRGARFVRGQGTGRAEGWALPPGLSIITAHDPNDLGSPRTARHLPRFAAAAVPAPPDWSAWQALLADDAGPRAAALNVPPRDGFGTTSASLVGIPEAGPPVWLFAAGPPDRAPFEPVALPLGVDGVFRDSGA